MHDQPFTADWLALREPLDHRFRSAELLGPLQRAGERLGWTRAVDLGAGTGSNLRYLAPALPFIREWTLFDHDADLLALADAPDATRTVWTVRGDLAREGLKALAGAHFVTASALLDLVGEDWLCALVNACARDQFGALFALSYDGEVEWDMPDADDELVRGLVHEHQSRDKGLGPALGPRAALVARDLFRAAGHDIWLRSTPWVLEGPEHAPLTSALVGGWSTAALETRPDLGARIRSWAARRLSAVGEGDYRVTVGHRDLLALPPGMETPDAAAAAAADSRRPS